MIKNKLFVNTLQSGNLMHEVLLRMKIKELLSRKCLVERQTIKLYFVLLKTWLLTAQQNPQRYKIQEFQVFSKFLIRKWMNELEF